MCSALHALIVTATIFTDTLTQIIYRIEAQETKQALAPWDRESQAGCHIASCDTQKTLIYDGWSQPITHLQRSGKHSRAVLCCWAHSSDTVQPSSMKARKECAPDYYPASSSCWAHMQQHLGVSGGSGLHAIRSPLVQDSQNPRSPISNTHFCKEVADLKAVCKPWGL